jgi:cytochrome c oxidase cbb3-type subunit 4
MDQGTLQGIGTIFAMLAFLGICWWAFSRHKKKDFEEASRLPFEGPEPGEDGAQKSSTEHDQRGKEGRNEP